MADLMPDISHYQAVLTLDKARCVKANCVGILFKATEATSFADPHFTDNVKSAEAVGVPWGAYHFVRQGQGSSQADYFWSHVEAAGTPTFVLMDWEEGDRNTARDFLERLKRLADCAVAQYIGAHGRQNGGAFDNVPTVVPQYGSPQLEDVYKPDNAPLAAWQYTNGSFNGTTMPTNICALGGDTSVVYRKSLLGFAPSEEERDEMAFTDFKDGWQAFRDGIDLHEDWDGDKKFGWLAARFAATNPRPEAGDGTIPPHSHTVTGTAT